MFTDLYLKFADEAEANSLLYRTATVRDHDRELTEEEKALGEDNFAIKHIEIANYQNIDVIGVLYVNQSDPENPPIPEEGWHVNVRLVNGENIEALEPFAVQPKTPLRVWG